MQPIFRPLPVALLHTKQIAIPYPNVAQALLTDIRDSKTYVVRKLADGNCWMVQNLRLGGSSSITLTPADSDVAANFTLSASTNSFGINDDAASIDVANIHDNGNAWLTPITVGSDSIVNTTGTPPSSTQYIGNYYNWYAATAGSGTYAMSTDGQNATQSICPKGWILPTGVNTIGDYTALYDGYGNIQTFYDVTSIVLSGIYWSTYSSGQGANGLLWTKTTAGAVSAYDALARNSSFLIDNGYKQAGRAVRCLAR